MNGDALRSMALGKAVLALVVLAAIILGEIVGVLAVLFLGIEVESLPGLIIPELTGAAVAAGGMALLAGTSPLKLTREDIVYAFRFGWWSVAIGVGLFVLELFGYLPDTPFHARWMQRTLECALFCLAVGVLEEYMFRGVLFNSLLALFGGTHRGVVRSVVVTSILFGMAHIYVSEIVDAPTAAQAMLKIAQTGIYSVLLCVIFLRTRRLWGVALFHAVDDFLILAPSIGFFGETPSTDYVVTGDEAAVTILFYVIIISLYLPFLIKSLRELHRGQDVYRGVFMEHALERAKAQVARMDQESALVPMPPFGPQAPYETTMIEADEGVRGEHNDQPSQTDQEGHHQPDVGQQCAAAERLALDAQNPPSEGHDRRHRPPVPKGL